MNRLIKFIAAIGISLAMAPSFAGVIAQDPLFINAQADPRVLFLLSRDHQLYIKAFTDYSDLDGDGFLDTTFRGDIEYDGYFNPRKCYTYQSNRFEPTAAATTESVTITLPNATTVTKQQYVCGSGRWSGNLLNWASMTRMDIVRKVLYGGYRSTDSETETVLERALLPRDVHAFAKVFDAVTTANLAKFTPYSSGTVYSFCNVTLDSSNALTKDSTVVPIIRVASGAYPQWAAGEVTQCGTGGATQPGSVVADLNARVKVCDNGGGTDTTAGPGPRCKTYPKGTAKKPIGLMQQYGDADAPLGLRFGLMTGSWGKNKSGGVLRRNVGLIANNSGKYPNNYNCATANEGRTTGDEIDFCTGQFVNNQERKLGTGSDALPATGGIIGTLNRFRISSYEMDDAKYRSSCDSPGIDTIVDGQCVDWGNPISEMYLEALRYLQAGPDVAGTPTPGTPTAAFASNDSTYIQGLPATVPWQDPIPKTEWCAKSNIVILSTGLNSFDTDQTAHNLGWPTTTAQLTNDVAGSGYENLSGSYLIGSNTGPGNYDAVCTGKTLGNFSDFSGICPELPNLAGSYHIAGLGLGTALHDLRPGYKTQRDKLWLTTKPDYAARQPLSTFAVALAENLPEFSIPVGTNKITILPGCQSNSSGSAALGATGWRTCSMTDLKVEPGSDNTRGAFVISWEDSAWGNDYDMDGISLIRYCVGSACTGYSNFTGTPVANTLYVKAAAMQANAGFALKFGYTITGSTADGASLPVLRPGGKNYNYVATYENTVPAGSTWTTPTWVAYTPGASTAKLLKNPLWYTAKYAAWPNWDVKINDVNRTACTTCDGIPDNFFEVRNPSGLEPAVGTALKESLADPSSASAIATNSTRLDADTFVYQARFKAVNWSGEVLAYPISGTGTAGYPLWGAADAARIPAASARQIFTLDRTAGTGVNFAWSSLSAKQKAALDNAAYVANNSSSLILEYLRGDQTNEQPGGSYRLRAPVILPSISGDPRSGNTVTSLIGDIINSDPVFVGSQNFSYNNISAITGSGTYVAQVAKKVTSSGSVKNPLVLVNSNDGMMHAIDGKNGNELFTYVPSWLICADETTGTGCNSGINSSPLRSLTDPNYQHRYFLDGSLAVGDAYIDKDGAGSNDTLSWKTVVVGAAAAGGKGVFALDLTKTYDGTSTSTAATTANPSVALANTQSAYSTFLATGAASVAMWEFTDKVYGSNGDVDLGYTFGVPVIGRAANGAWVAIFGNGYNSANGKAVLYVVNLANGQLIRKIDVGDGSTAASPNGLSSPAAIFDTVSGSFSTVYAGDLKGRIWKFDLSNANPLSWGIEHGAGTPLFVARDDSGVAQPITAPLEVGRHTSGGTMVYFGTGKYFEKNDNSSTDLQTIYAIWDTTTAADAIPDASTDTGAEKANVLQKHDLLAEVSVTAGTPPITNNYRVTDTVANIPATKRGWYMNLQVVGGSLKGERVVSTPILRNNRVIYTTLIPSASPCEFGGTSWIMEFDPMTGNRLADSVFDVNRDGSFTSADFVTVTIGGNTVSVPANGVQSTEGIIKAPAIISAGGKEYKIGSGTTGQILSIVEKGSTNRPRASWRQLK